MNTTDTQLFSRVARLEAEISALKSAYKDIQLAAYNAAKEQQDEEQAAYYARMYRNILISETDNRALTDRTLSEEWREYRQRLRDLTEQEGFPLNIEFPIAPDE